SLCGGIIKSIKLSPWSVAILSPNIQGTLLSYDRLINSVVCNKVSGPCLFFEKKSNPVSKVNWMTKLTSHHYCVLSFSKV
ncbi:hypothetical protein, partial [Salmonella sp. gx-f5]|uniref:hypothetical protein n=1 Tax=Salmonella sp. gx-f5 TaxID=2582605 RepID=UPI001F1A4CD0